MFLKIYLNRVSLVAFMTLIIVFSYHCISYGREIHVSTIGRDSNSGTSTDPLRNIQSAIDLAEGGDEVILHEGKYFCTQITIAKKNTNTHRPLVVKGVSQQNVITDHQGSANGWYIDNQSYIIIKNLTIQDSIEGVKFSGNCHDNIIEKCIIRNIRNRGIFSSTRKEYANNFPHDIKIFNCDIYDVGVDTAGADISLGRNCTNFIIKGNRLHGRIDGVVMEDASSGHVIIENIIFDHYEEDGIDIKNTYKRTLNAKSDTILIKSNIIFNHPKQTGITIQKGSKNILIEGNFITKARWGIWMRSHDTSHVAIFENNIVSNSNIGIVINGDAKGNVIIKDNIITENGTIATEMVSAGIAIYAGENYEIFSNTISRNSLCNGLNGFNLQLIIGIDQVYTTTLYMNKYHYANQDKIIKWGENYYNLHDFQKIEKQDKNSIFQKDTKFLKP